MTFRKDIRSYVTGDALTIIYETGADLTDATLRFGLWAFDGFERAATPALEKTEGDGITVTNITDATVTVQIDTSDVAAAGLYWHELKASIGGLTVTLSRGTLLAAPTGYVG